jgi:type III secretory pathway component EscT
MALGLAACVAPAVERAADFPTVPWLLAAVAEMARGIPVALAAAVPLWAATMAGGIADATRGSQDTTSAATVEGRATPLGVPLSLLACALFLATGGPARIAEALAFRLPGAEGLQASAADLVAGIGLAVALGGPLLAAGVVVDVAAALIARAASPAQVHALLVPLRALALLAVFGLVFARMAGVLARSVGGAP